MVLNLKQFLGWLYYTMLLLRAHIEYCKCAGYKGKALEATAK